MISAFRLARGLAGLLAVASASLFFIFGTNAQAQITKGKGPPVNFPFGFEPGKKIGFEGVFRVDGAPKGKMEVLTRLVEPSAKSVVVYTRQADDAIFKLAAALEAKADGLKDCPTHFVFLFVDRKKLEEKAGGFKKVSLLQSNRINPRDWDLLKLDPKMTALVFLVERGKITTRLDVMQDSLNAARIDELTKAILAYAGPEPPSPTAPLNMKERLAGHPGGARRMVFSPDGKWLYSHGTQQGNGIDARISKWELVSGKQLASAPSHGGGGHMLELTRDGATLLSAGSNSEIKFWEAAALKLTDTVNLPATPFSLRLSPDDKTFAIGFSDRTLRIYSMADKKEKFVLRGHTDRVKAVDYSPDGKLLVSGDEDGKIKLWNAIEGKEIATWPGHTNTVECIAFSADGKWVASGGREMRGINGPGRARLWDVETGKEVRDLESTRGNGVLSIAFIQGGKKLAIAGESPLIRIIDLETGKEARELGGQPSGISCLAVSSDGATLASAEWNATIRLWNVKEKK